MSATTGGTGGTGSSERPRVLILMYKEAARNPIARMYANGLRPVADVTIACTDPERAAAAFPDDVCLQIAGAGFVERLRGVWSTVKRPLARRRENSLAGPGGASLDVGAGNALPGPYVGRRAARATRLSLPLLRTELGTALSSVEQLRRAERPTLIIAVDGDALLAAWMLGELWRVPYVYSMYEVYPNQYTTDTPQARYNMAAVEAFGVRRAAHLLVMDPTWATLLARRYRVPRSRATVIRICPPLPTRSARPAIEGACRFYYHGGYTPGRGLESLVLAMADVEGGELHMRGMGAALEPELRRLAALPEIAGRVIFHPPLPLAQLPEAAADHDVGISIACPSTANGRFLLGFKTCENLSAGLAIAGADSRALVPFIAEHDLGVTFRGGCSASIAAAFRSCVAAPAQVARWKASARALAEREFNNVVQEARLREVLRPWLGAT